MITQAAVEHDLQQQSTPLLESYSTPRTPELVLPQCGRTLLLEPMEAEECLSYLIGAKIQADCLILDPWYSRSPHKFRNRNNAALTQLIWLAGELSQHVFVWGWPTDVAVLIERIPPNLTFRHWLTWHYRNVPSRSRGWRPTQQSCLHLSRANAKLYPENLRDNQEGMFQMGADSVISAGALVGRAGRSQATGHPAQKPEAVFEPLILMTTPTDGLVIDPTAGSGTTGAVATKLNRRSLLSDRSDRYTRLAEERLNISRTPIF